MKKNKVIDIGVYVYTLLFVLYSFTGRILPLSLFVGDNLNSLIYIFFAGFGCLLVVGGFFASRIIIKSEYFVVLSLFVVMMLVSSLVNIDMGYVDNAKTVIWTVIQITIFYSLYLRRDKQSTLGILKWLFVIICAIWTIAVIISLTQYVVQDTYMYDISGMGYRYQGFYGGRLFGIFNDPNYAAVTSSYVIFMFMYIYMKSRKRWYVKGVIVFAVLLNVMYILLSGSRTALVASVCGFFVYLFLWFKGRYAESKWGLLKASVSAFLILASVLVISEPLKQASIVLPQFYVSRYASKVGHITQDKILMSLLRGRSDVILYWLDSPISSNDISKVTEQKVVTDEIEIMTVSNAVATEQQRNITDSEEILKETESAEIVYMSSAIQNSTDNQETNLLEREDIQNGNFSNNRIKIWKQYLQGMKGRYLIGTSPRNMMAYLEKTGTAEFVLERKYETHNGYLSLFVGCGILGCIPILIFIILVGRRIGRYSFSNKKLDEDFIILFSILVVILVYTIFFTELFFVNNLTTVLFWTILGSLWYWLDAENKISK